MKLLITSTGKTLESDVDPRFGRAQFFILYDTESEEFSVVDNVQSLNQPSGAGIQAAQNVVESGAEAVISGNCGPKAFKVLSAAGLKVAGLKVYLCSEGTVKEAIEKYKKGNLVESVNANVQGHWM